MVLAAVVVANGQHYEKSEGGGHSYGHGVDAAVKSYHSVNTYPVPSLRNLKNPVLDIDSGPLPITLRFNTHSSDINAMQKHFGSPGQVQKAAAIDEPDVLIQAIKKPVINEIREVISPYRHRTQEVRPVQEKIESIIAKGQEGGHHQYGHQHQSHY